MKIALTSMGPALDDEIDARFGRCQYFLIVDPNSLEFEAVKNPNTALGGGAGIQSAQLMGDRNVSVVLTGNCGPNAFQTFGAAGIKVITGVGGQVRQAVEGFKSGTLKSTSSPNVESHYGMGMGGGPGTGRGMGRGMGGGMNQRQAGGQPRKNTSPRPSPNSTNKDEELKSMKDQAESLEKQMEQITTLIQELEDK
jgi:predicted Fe-Mo cluster-binding NifX family protein